MDNDFEAIMNSSTSVRLEVTNASTITSTIAQTTGNIIAHDQVCNEVMGVDEDPAKGAYSQDSKMRLDNINAIHATPIDYFEQLFPMHYLHNTIERCTNAALEDQNLPVLSSGEFLKFLGITLAMGLG